MLVASYIQRVVRIKFANSLKHFSRMQINFKEYNKNNGSQYSDSNKYLPLHITQRWISSSRMNWKHGSHKHCKASPVILPSQIPTSNPSEQT